MLICELVIGARLIEEYFNDICADVMTVKQAKVLADRRQRLCEFTTSQIAGSRIGSKEMQVAVQVGISSSHCISFLRNRTRN